MSSNSDLENSSFIDLLNANHRWPCDYTFKFIGKKKDIETVMGIILDTKTVTLKESKKGNYHSVSILKNIRSAKDVIDIYERVYMVCPKVIKL